MVEAVDAVGEGQAMVRDNNPAAALFFIVVQLVIAWTLFSFFTVTVFDTYADLKSNGQGTRLLTAAQRQWVDNVRVMLATRPHPQMRPLNSAAYAVVSTRAFEWFIMAMIIANVVALACSHYPMDNHWIDGIEDANYAFTLVFTLEAVLKLVALGWTQYISTPWHQFDLFLVVAAIASAAVSISAQVAGHTLSGGGIATLLRILRVARLFRLLKASPGLQRVVRALIYALPAIGNVFGILSLLWFIFAVVGMNIFSGVRFGEWTRPYWREGQLRPWLNADANFDTFPIAFMTVFRITTGDDFNGIMRELMVQAPHCSGDNCGDLVLPPLFFIAAHFITAFLALKLFLVVVADAYLVAIDSGTASKRVYKLTRETASGASPSSAFPSRVCVCRLPLTPFAVLSTFPLSSCSF